jgi:hypothetical protein
MSDSILRRVRSWQSWQFLGRNLPIPEVALECSVSTESDGDNLLGIASEYWKALMGRKEKGRIRSGELARRVESIENTGDEKV